MLIADLKENNSIADQLVAAGVKLQERGGRLVACCPLHDDRTPSFFVFKDQQRWRCFGCQASGEDAIDLVQQLYHLDFKGALRHLGVEGGRFEFTSEEKRKIVAAKVKRDRRQHRRVWLETKVDELSLFVRCSHLLLDGIGSEADLEERAFIYHLLPVWKFQLSILLDGWNWEKWQFYQHDQKPPQ